MLGLKMLVIIYMEEERVQLKMVGVVQSLIGKCLDIYPKKKLKL